MNRVQPAVGLLLVLGLWALLTTLLSSTRPIVEWFSPTHAISSLGELLVTPRTWHHVAASLKRIAWGLGSAFLVGVPLGLALGKLPWLERASVAVIQFVRMISPLAWMPVAVIILGIGDAPVYFLIFIAAVWPIVFNTLAGVKAADAKWMEMARSLGASPAELIRHVTIPAVATHVATGMRLALGVSWIVLVPAEMLGVRAGLGYAILDARDRMDYPELMATILLIGFVGWIMDTLVNKSFNLSRLGRTFGRKAIVLHEREGG